MSSYTSPNLQTGWNLLNSWRSGKQRARTPVQQKTVDFVDSALGPVVVVVSIDVERLGWGGHPLFSAITRMTNAVSRGLRGRGRTGSVEAQEVFLPSQPLESLDGLTGVGAMPATWRLDGDGVFGQGFLTPVPVTGRDGSDTFFHGKEIGILRKSSWNFWHPAFHNLTFSNVPHIAVVAEVGFREEALESITSILMVVFFDEHDEFIRGNLTREDDAKRWIDGQDFDQVTG